MRTHGTPSGYFNGCRCDECRRAGAQYRTDGGYQAYLDGTARKPPLFYPGDRTQPYDADDPRHGSISAYTLGCRCTWCLSAGDAYRKHRKAGQKLPKGWNARDQKAAPNG